MCKEMFPCMHAFPLFLLLNKQKICSAMIISQQSMNRQTTQQPVFLLIILRSNE